MTPELIEKLKALAREQAWTDDEEFDIDSYASGNADDAFFGGQEDGRINLAREILDSLGISYK